MDFPRFPNCCGLSGRTLLRLLQNQKITHRDFQNISASYRLSAWIYELRRLGWPISDRWEKGLTSDPAGRMARFKRYWLDNEFLESIKPDAQFTYRIESFKNSVKSCEQKKRP